VLAKRLCGRKKDLSPVCDRKTPMVCEKCCARAGKSPQISHMKVSKKILRRNARHAIL